MNRVLGQPQFLKGAEHTSHALVDGGDHRRELDVVLVLLDLDRVLRQHPVLPMRGLLLQRIQLGA